MQDLFQSKTKRLNQKGLSIIEVLIAAGLLTIIALGVATMIENMAKEQKRIVLFNSIRETKSRIEFLLQDSNAWQNTVNNAANDAFNAGATGWACLRNNASCVVIAPTAPVKLILKDSANNDAFGFAGGLLTWASAGSNGFTEAGAPCTTFNAAAGSGVDACPYSYRLVYVFDCGGAGPCNNPRVRIVGRLIFNPSTNGLLNRFRTLVSRGDLSTIATGATMGKYDVSVDRTASNVNRSFRHEYQLSAAGGTCPVAGVGQCATAWATYPRSYNNIYDPFALSTLGDANRSIRFNQTGYYECAITMTAFATRGFSIRLQNTSTGTTVATGSTFAGYWAQASAVINVRFNVSDTAHIYYVQYQCQDNNPRAQIPDPGTNDVNTVNQCTLGFVTDYGVAKTMNSIVCYRIERTFL